MADEEDLAALHGGSPDLIRRDFRGANLNGQAIGARDFSHCHLENANFARSDLSGSNFERAHLMNLNVEDANLSSTNWHGAVLAVNFRRANLRDSKLERSIFSKCDLREADLRGASFRRSTIQEGTQFEGARVDETTMFDGVEILRAIARQEAFRFYEVDRGALRRISEARDASPSDPKAADRAKLIARIESLQADLRLLEPGATDPVEPGLGHNNPPEVTPVDRVEHASLQEALTELKTQAAAPNPDKAEVGKAENLLIVVGAKILRWAASHADTAAEEFAKGLGKNLSDPLKVAAAWTLVAGGLSQITQMARAFFGF